MKRAPMTLITLGLALVASGCILRSTEDYQRDTRSVVDKETNAIKNCLDTARAADENAAGDVVVTFNVAKKTGAIENVAIVEDKTTAPASLQACVTDALNGLMLDPGDMAPAEVTATWSLQGG